jgi:hypothetical protein
MSISSICEVIEREPERKKVGANVRKRPETKFLKFIYKYDKKRMKHGLFGNMEYFSLPVSMYTI